MQRFLILGLVIVLSLVGGRAEGNDLENAFVTFAANHMTLLKMEADGQISGLHSLAGNLDAARDEIVRHSFSLWLLYHGPWKQGESKASLALCERTVRLCRDIITDNNMFNNPLGLEIDDWDKGTSLTDLIGVEQSPFFIRGEELGDAKDYELMVEDYQDWVKKL